MSSPIITSLRTARQLHESLLHTAQELAHRASIYGVVRVSLRYLADKCHCCKQTIINHIKRLIALGILKKRKPVKITNTFCEVNKYTFTISWEGKPGSNTAQTCNGQNLLPKLPLGKQKLSPTQTNPKYGQLEADLAQVEKSLRLYDPESQFYRWTLEEITRLKGCIQGSNERKLI